MKPNHWYCVYVGSKQLAVAILFLVFAFTMSKAVNGYYSRSTCAACNDLASQYPKVGFEFTACASQYTPGIHKNNLMTSNLLSPAASPVSVMVPMSFLLLVLAMGYGLWAWWRWSNEFQPEHQFLYNTFVTMLWIVIGNGFWQLFLRSGCYLSAWNMDFMATQWWLNAVVLVPLVGYALAINFCTSCDKYNIVQYMFLGLSVVSVLTMTIFSMYLAQLNFKHTKVVIHWVFMAVMAYSLLDGALFWWFYRSPKGGEHVEPLLPGNQGSDKPTPAAPKPAKAT